MSNVVVTLATNRIQIFRDATPDELLNSVTYINVTSVNPLVQVKKRLDGSTPGMSDPTTHPTVTTEDTDWIVELHMADGRIEHINLADVVTPAGWTNDQTGYEQAEDDIYAAFPAGGGGGGTGTVTSIAIDGGDTGYTVTGSPVTTSGTITLVATDVGANRGDYGPGLTLNFRDLVVYDNQIWMWLGGTTTSTNWAADSSDFTSIGISPAYGTKKYKWIGDGGAATGTVVANTLGVTINVTNPSAGTYVFTAASGTPFTANKTTITVQNISDRGAWRFTDSVLTDNTECRAFFADVSETGADPVKYQVIIEVEP